MEDGFCSMKDPDFAIIDLGILRSSLQRGKRKIMEEYKVLLVDDEPQAIDAMEGKIRWKDLHFQLVGSATNGVKALELVEKLQPDVVLTDIRMPYMDGLELTRRLNQEYSNIRIMLCTGFDEFEYAKEAVHLDVQEYILKPINAAELSESLLRLKDSLDHERQEKLNIRKLENYFKDSLPALRSNFFVSLIEGRVEWEDYKRFLSSYEITMNGPLFCCLVFHTSSHHIPEGMEPMLLSLSVEREIKRRIKEEGRENSCQEFIYLGNTVVIVELDSEEKVAQATDACDRFCRWAYRVMKAVVTAGVGRPCDSLFEIHTSYEGAREAVSYRVLYGTRRAINIGEVVPKEGNRSFPSEESRMKDLYRSIQLGDEKEIKEAARKEIEKMRKNAGSINQYNMAALEIVNAFYRFCENNSLDFNEIIGDSKNIYKKVPDMDEGAFTDWVTAASLVISHQLSNARDSSSKRLVTDAKKLVKDYYMDSDISLDMVCSKLGVSNSYFSSVFKKETGQAFISYLTDYRMEVAEKLLFYTQEKSYAIAEKVGYQDANYFGYVFKKKYGVSPSKYRAEKLKK